MGFHICPICNQNLARSGDACQQCTKPLPEKRQRPRAIGIKTELPVAAGGYDAWYMLPKAEWGLLPQDFSHITSIRNKLYATAHAPGTIVQAQAPDEWLHEENQAEPGEIYTITAQEAIAILEKLTIELVAIWDSQSAASEIPF